jgi:hypothetical protein
MVAHIRAVNIGAGYIAPSAQDTVRDRTAFLPRTIPLKGTGYRHRRHAPLHPVVECLRWLGNGAFHPAMKSQVSSKGFL